MEPYHFWLIAAIVLIIVEIFTATFAVLCFAIGCLFAVGADLLGWSINIQILVMVVGTVLSFVLVRPVALKYLNRKKEVVSNADALIGRIATVSEKIDFNAGTGRVAVDGDDWKAYSNDGAVIEKGEKVEIVNRDSIILTVKK